MLQSLLYHPCSPVSTCFVSSWCFLSVLRLDVFFRHRIFCAINKGPTCDARVLAERSAGAVRPLPAGPTTRFMVVIYTLVQVLDEVTEHEFVAFFCCIGLVGRFLFFSDRRQGGGNEWVEFLAPFRASFHTSFQNLWSIVFP